MKTLVAALLLFASALAQANGRCMAPNRSDGPDCKPQARALMFHRVTSSFPAGGTVVAPERFVEILDFIQREGYVTVTASELSQHMRGMLILPAKSVALTFDDGWIEQLDVARELSRRGMKGTFYIVSGFFNDRRYMSEAEVKLVSSLPGIEVGAHSHTHMTEFEETHKMSEVQMLGELAMSKLIIEKVIGKSVSSYAWPYGEHTGMALNAAKSMGYMSTVLVSRQSVNVTGSDPYRIERLNIDGRCTVKDVQFMLETGALGECK